MWGEHQAGTVLDGLGPKQLAIAKNKYADFVAAFRRNHQGHDPKFTTFSGFADNAISLCVPLKNLTLPHQYCRWQASDQPSSMVEAFGNDRLPLVVEVQRCRDRRG